MALLPIVLPREIKTEKEDKEYGKFIIEPYEQGYGHTIGNSLRRVLLSSLEGAAITSCRVKGVVHEFSKIDGVSEDVIYILLNLKKIRLKLLYSDGPELLKLSVKGERVVRAKDIEKNPNVEILNPEQIIATIDSPNGKLEMEMDVRKGRGYATAKENEYPNMPANTLTIDSIFSPIRKVNYKVEMTRVEHRVDYDRLIMEIWTDGSILPSDALSYAAKILRDSLNVFVVPKPKPEEPESLAKLAEREKMLELMSQKIEVLGFSQKLLTLLLNANLSTIGELAKKSKDELLKINGIGVASLNEIESKLKEIGLSLGMKIE